MSSIQVTTADKLMVVPILTRAIGSAILRLVTGPFSKARANTTFKDVVFAALRTNLSLMSPATEQFMIVPTEKAYLDFAKQNGFQPDTDVLASGLKVHWLGKKTAEKIFLYFHGLDNSTAF